MQKAIIIINSRILSALGTIEQTTDSLFSGKTGIQPGPSFGVPVPCAPFQDLSFRRLEKITEVLSFKIQDNKSLLFIYCAAKGDLSDLESFYHQKGPCSIINSLLEIQSRKIITYLKIRPSKSTIISAACASGAAAIDYAKRYLIQGIYSDVLIFGYDVISEFVVKGFHSLGALSHDPARPFDKSRNGLTLGDGAALIHLTYDKPSVGDILISGTATSNDANHRTGPSRTGEGLLRAINTVLQDSNLTPEDIGAIKCHGTATNYNDAMEAKALFSCFKDNIPPCVSFKGAIGHTSGAGSLLEIAIAANLIKRKSLPPTIGFEYLGVDEPLPIRSSSQQFEKDSILCLSAGFGGLNAAIVIREHR